MRKLVPKRTTLQTRLLTDDRLLNSAAQSAGSNDNNPDTPDEQDTVLPVEPSESTIRSSSSKADAGPENSTERPPQQQKVRCGNCRNVAFLSITHSVRVECNECGHINAVTYQRTPRRRISHIAIAITIGVLLTTAILLIGSRLIRSH